MTHQIIPMKKFCMFCKLKIENRKLKSRLTTSVSFSELFNLKYFSFKKFIYKENIIVFLFLAKHKFFSWLNVTRIHLCIAFENSMITMFRKQTINMIAVRIIILSFTVLQSKRKMRE